MNYVKKFLGGFTLESALRRLFTSVFITNILLLLFNKGVSFESKQLFEAVEGKIGFVGVVLLVLLLFIGESLISILKENEKLEKLLLFLSYCTYAYVCVLQEKSIWFFVGASLVLLGVCHYTFSDWEAKFKLPAFVTPLVLSSLGLFFALAIGFTTAGRVFSLHSPNFDFGIFSQMFYNMSQTGLAETTCERNELLSHFAIHVSPVYYLMLPFYMLVPHPATLEFLQAILLASGVIPLWLLAKKIGLSNKAVMAFATVYTLYPALSGGCYYDLHENKFLTPILLWLFYFVEKNSGVGIAIFSVLLLSVKEDAACYLVFLAIYMLIAGKNRKKAVLMLLGGIAYFGIVTFILSQYGRGVMTWRYDNFIYGNGGLISMVKAVIMSPAKVISEIFNVTDKGYDTNKIEFILYMLLPLGFLPFVSKKLSRFLLLCPLILVNLMPDYVYQYSISFQYTYGSFAFLLYGAMLNYADLTPKFKRTVASFVTIASILIFSASMNSRTKYFKMYLDDKEVYDTTYQALQEIPEEASVTANTFLVVPLSQRAEIYDYDAKNFPETDYIVFDIRYSENAKEYEAKYKDNPDWQVEKLIEGRVVILKNIGD